MGEPSSAESPRVYIETSVWGMLLPNQPRALREPTRRFLAQCRAGLFAPYVSAAVFEEIEQANPRTARQLLAEINKLHPEELKTNETSEFLASKYIEVGILPPKKRFDALHVAIATVRGMNILVSWNHRHLANDRKRQLFNALNRLSGYKQDLVIQTPFGALRW